MGLTVRLTSGARRRWAGVPLAVFSGRERVEGHATRPLAVWRGYAAFKGPVKKPVAEARAERRRRVFHHSRFTSLYVPAPGGNSELPRFTHGMHCKRWMFEALVVPVWPPTHKSGTPSGRGCRGVRQVGPVFVIGLPIRHAGLLDHLRVEVDADKGVPT